MSKIILIGANQGALVAGELLGKQGYDVTLYEKNKRDEVAYPWHDNMAPATFERIGIPYPPESVAVKKDADWTFYPPDKKTNFAMKVPEDKRDFKVMRRPLNDWLYERTKGFAKINYETQVNCVIYKGGKVCGVKLADGTEVSADLVIDCGGANSGVRESLPKELGIETRLNPHCTFQVRRTFFKRSGNAAAPEKTHNLYMRHLGEKGITWCADYPKDNVVDVLVGRIDELTDEAYNRALNDIRAAYPIVGDEVVCGGELVVIPLRHAASLMVADGYVILGDSAFMTIPLMGSGMASSMLGAKILAEVLDGKDDFSKENLYRYQAQYMQEIGGKNSGIDVLKNWMIDIDADKLSFLMNKQIIGEKEFSSAGSGNGVQLTFGDIMQKLAAGIGHLPMLFNLIGATTKMKKQMAIGKSIPAQWDEAAFKQWQAEYEANFQ